MRFAAGAERATAPRAGWRRVGRRTIRHGKWPGHAVRPASRKTETLSEIRLFITTTEKNAEAILSLMTDAFEDEGYAIATMEIDEKNVSVGHEATVSKVGEEQMFYLMSRGLSENQAQSMIVNGFIEPFVRELPMEYAVELNRLMQLEMEGAIG